MHINGERLGFQSDNNNIITNSIRLLGVMILLVGLVYAFYVVSKAWSLLDKPEETINPFSLTIEQESKVNAYIHTITQQVLQTSSSLEQQGQTTISEEQKTQLKGIEQFNFSYFIAWAIVIALICVVGRISLWLITTGSKLILYSANSKKEIKSIMRELAFEIKRADI